MPPGYIHINFWKRFLILAVAMGSALCFVNVTLGISFLFGYLLGYICSPDLDQIGLSSDEGRALKIFGPFGVLWIMIWLPYAYIIPHRSFASHGWLFSTILRMIYLFGLPLFLIWYKFNYIPSIDLLVGTFLGQLFSDSIHIFLDTFYR